MKKILMATLLSASLSSQAAELFVLTTEVEGITTSSNFQTVEDFAKAFSDTSLIQNVSNYSPVSATSFSLFVRGVPATASYDANATTLTFNVDKLNIHETFTGLNRDASQEQFEDFLKKSGDDILTRLLQEMVATTAIDPVAGNPNSLMSTMASADFSLGSTAGGIQASSGGDITGENKSNVGGLLSLGIQFGSYSADNFDIKNYTLPISYIKPLSSDPRKAFILDLPISYTETEGAVTGKLSIGMGLRFPIAKYWYLTPMVRAGLTASEDLGSAAAIYSGSLTSNYNIYFDDLRIAISNMVGVYQTTALSSGDFDVDYDLSNQILRNGIQFSGAMNTKLFGKPSSWEFDITDTLFFGDELFVEHYNDIAFSVGTRGQASGIQWNALRLGVSYTIGDNDFEGFKVNFGFRF